MGRWVCVPGERKCLWWFRRAEGRLSLITQLASKLPRQAKPNGKRFVAFLSSEGYSCSRPLSGTVDHTLWSHLEEGSWFWCSACMSQRVGGLSKRALVWDVSWVWGQVEISFGFPGGTVVKNPPTNAGDTRDAGSIPRSGRSPGRENGNPLLFLPGKPHGQRSLPGYSLWGCRELDMTEHTPVTSWV